VSGRVERCGEWTVVELDPGFDGGAPALTAERGGRLFAIVPLAYERTVAIERINADGESESPPITRVVHNWMSEHVAAAVHALASIYSLDPSGAARGALCLGRWLGW
jgi:hypothetical protein